MQAIGLATLVSRPEPVEGLGVSKLYAGIIYTGRSYKRAYLKDIPPKEILSECVCSILLLALGLPTPAPYLVSDPYGYVEPEHGLFFGTEDAAHPSLRKLLEKGHSEVMARLLEWEHAPATAVFDEWVANGDRNQGNLLYDGSRGFMLIDHGRALGAQDDTVPLPEQAFTNHLATCLCTAFSEHGRVALLSALQRQNDDYQSMVNLLSDGDLPRAQTYGMSERLRQVLSFLAARIPHMPRLVERHGPQGSLDLR